MDNREVFVNQRDKYRKQIVSTVVTKLQDMYGSKGFDERTIRRMMQFANLFSDTKIVAQLATKLSRSHCAMV